MIMKKLFILIFSICLPLMVFAQANVPHIGTAQSLKAEAQIGQKEFIEAMLKLKDNVRELRDQKTFEEFFYLLEDFEQLFHQYQLDLIYPDLMKDLGRSMVMHGNRWLKVGKDTPAKIMHYQKWADLVAGIQFQNQVIEEIEKISNPDAFKQAFVNLVELNAWAEANYAEDLYLAPIYRKTISEISFKALIQTDLKDHEDREFWLKGINTQQTAQDYLAFLNDKLLREPLLQEDASDWFLAVIELGKQFRSIKGLSSSTNSNYGVLASDLVSKTLFNEQTIDVKAFEELVALLDVSSFRSLVFRWVNPEKVFSDQYSVTLIGLSKILLDNAKSLGLSQTVLDIERYTTTRLSTAYISENSIEGTYLLRSENNKEMVLTIIRESESRVIGAMCSKNGAVCFPFFNMQYSLSDNVFWASERLPDDDSYQNIPAQISFDENGQVLVSLPYAYRTDTEYRGSKIESYENLMASPFMDANPMSGVYEGTLKLSGKPKKVRLMITTLGEYSFGRLETEDGSLRIDFGKGNDGNIGFLYLTTGQNRKNSWLHLRLKQINDDELEGLLISGGQGLIDEISFKRK